MTNKKLIIHETDCHGCGKIYFNGRTHTYTYDDGELGDARRAVQSLIDIGFIDDEDVVIFDDDNNIYEFVESALIINERK